MYESIDKILKRRVLLLDGAIGTEIIKLNLSETEYRGKVCLSIKNSQKDNHDLLSITQPQIIENIHKQYLEAGADIITTNSFNAQYISLVGFGLQEMVYDINFEASRLARNIADKYSTSEKPRFVAGSIGPNSDTLRSSYINQINGLIDGGSDLLLLETFFDLQNVNACLSAIDEVFKMKQKKIFVMISLTISDASGHLMSGDTLDDFLDKVSHNQLLSVGLNCSLGAEQMLPHLKLLASKAICYVSAHPSAGLPNRFGRYDESAQKMSKIIKQYLDLKLVNIVGGCCGTTPKHIKQIASFINNYVPRSL